MQKFSALFGVMFGVKLYGITDNLNCTLQRSITAFDAKSAAETVCQTLLGLRPDASFMWKSRNRVHLTGTHGQSTIAPFRLLGPSK